MEFDLVCVLPSHGYKAGDRVTDPNEIRQIMMGHDNHFVRVPAPPKEDPAEKSSD